MDGRIEYYSDAEIDQHFEAQKKYRLDGDEFNKYLNHVVFEHCKTAEIILLSVKVGEEFRSIKCYIAKIDHVEIVVVEMSRDSDKVTDAPTMAYIEDVLAALKGFMSTRNNSGIRQRRWLFPTFLCQEFSLPLTSFFSKVLPVSTNISQLQKSHSVLTVIDPNDKSNSSAVNSCTLDSQGVARSALYPQKKLVPGKWHATGAQEGRYYFDGDPNCCGYYVIKYIEFYLQNFKKIGKNGYDLEKFGESIWAIKLTITNDFKNKWRYFESLGIKAIERPSKKINVSPPILIGKSRASQVSSLEDSGFLDISKGEVVPTESPVLKTFSVEEFSDFFDADNIQKLSRSTGRKGDTSSSLLTFSLTNSLIGSEKDTNVVIDNSSDSYFDSEVEPVLDGSGLSDSEGMFKKRG